MTEIYNCLPKPPGRESVVKCLSEGSNKMALAGIKPRPYGSQSRRFNYSTRLLYCNKINAFVSFCFYLEVSSLI